MKWKEDYLKGYGVTDVHNGMMTKLEDGDIIPGESISGVKLGTSKKQIMEDFPGGEVSEKCDGYICYDIENARFGFATDGRLDEISVGYGFNGKLFGCIGIGNTLEELAERIGGVFCKKHMIIELPLLKDFPGISFSVEDEEIVAAYKIEGIPKVDMIMTMHVFKPSDMELFDPEEDEIEIPRQYVKGESGYKFCESRGEYV